MVRANAIAAAVLLVSINVCTAISVLVSSSNNCSPLARGQQDLLTAIATELERYGHATCIEDLEPARKASCQNQRGYDLRLELNYMKESALRSTKSNQQWTHLTPAEPEAQSSSQLKSIAALAFRVNQAGAKQTNDQMKVTASLAADAVDALAQGWENSFDGTPLLPPGIALVVDLPRIGQQCMRPILKRASPLGVDFVTDADGVPSYVSIFSRNYDIHDPEADACIASVGFIMTDPFKAGRYVTSVQDFLKYVFIPKATTRSMQRLRIQQ